MRARNLALAPGIVTMVLPIIAHVASLMAGSRFSPRWRRRRRPSIDVLERRRLLTISVLNADGEFNYDTEVYSYAGVGFALNPIATIQGNYNGQSDTNPNDYQVQVNWGDGATENTGIELVSEPQLGLVLVKASHIYKTVNSYNVSFMATGPDGQSASATLTIASVSSMPDAASIPPEVPQTFTGARPLGVVNMSVLNAESEFNFETQVYSYTGVGFTLNPVATIDATYNGQQNGNPSDYRAQINWGDGPTWDTNVGLAPDTDSNGQPDVLVKGSHVYQTAGTYDVTVYVTGPDGQTESDSLTQAIVSNMPDAASIPPKVPQSFTGAQPLGMVDLNVYNADSEFNFSTVINGYAGISTGLQGVATVQGIYNGEDDSNPNDYHAQINWGDSPNWDSNVTLTTTTDSNGQGIVLVSGQHTYSKAGTYDVTVYATGPDGQTASNNFAIAYIGASYNVGIITPGFEPLNFAPLNSVLGVPAWESSLANSMDLAGYQDVIQYNWNSGVPIPGLAESAAATLEQTIITNVDALIQTYNIPDTTPINLHFVGHSRGVVVTNLALALLASDSRLPAQVKIGAIDDVMLDPHPANPASDSQESISTNPVGAILGNFASLVIAGFDRIANDPAVSMPPLINGNETFELYVQMTTAANDQGGSYLGFPGSILNLWGETAGLTVPADNLTNTVDHTHITLYYINNLFSPTSNGPNSNNLNNILNKSASNDATDSDGLDLIYPQEVSSLSVAQALVNQMQVVVDDQNQGEISQMLAGLLTLENMLSAGSGTTINTEFASSFLSAAQILVNTTEGSGTPATVSATGEDVTTTAGTPWVGDVAFFTASNASVVPGQYQATIEWGDGQSSAGVVLASGSGHFTIAGSHTYAKAGTFAVVVAIMDAGGASATTHSLANVAAISTIPPPVTVTSIGITTVEVAGRKKAKKENVIEIQFSGPLNTNAAQNIAAYQLYAGTTKKSHTTFKTRVRLARAVYNSSTMSVTLYPAGTLTLTHPDQLSISAGMVTDIYGRPIDGNDDGQPGGNFIATLSKKR
jgi:hypothetical protein